MEDLRQQNDLLNKDLQERIYELISSRKEKVSDGFTNATIVYQQDAVNDSAVVMQLLLADLLQPSAFCGIVELVPVLAVILNGNDGSNDSRYLWLNLIGLF